MSYNYKKPKHKRLDVTQRVNRLERVSFDNYTKIKILEEAVFKLLTEQEKKKNFAERVKAFFTGEKYRDEKKRVSDQNVENYQRLIDEIIEDESKEDKND